MPAGIETITPMWKESLQEALGKQRAELPRAPYAWKSENDFNMALSLHGTCPTSVFRLNGADENSASYALGWTLEQSPQYRALLVEAVFGEVLDVGDMVIALQKHADDRGYTDIELQAGLRFHAVLEAKRWWDLPGIPQLRRYLPRLAAAGAERQRLISVSAADCDYAQRHLPAQLDGIGVCHLSWRGLQSMARKAQSLATGSQEKLWLRQLIQHFQEFASMERQIDNKVYVVTLGQQPMVEGQTHTWIDVVEKDHCYFHPIGNTWPVQPPNYIGFRYGGRLQSVHHIESFKVEQNLATCNPL